MSGDDAQALVVRDERGHWLPGVSGNPGGRQPVVREVVELARAHTRAAITTLATIATDPKEPALARVKACEVLLNRGHGSVVPERDLGDGVDGEMIVVHFRIGPEQDAAGLLTAEELGPEK